jgi:ribosomal protein L11 methyltransferase
MNPRDCIKLFVYECRGPGLPSHEPVTPGLVGVWPEPPFTYLFFEGSADQPIADWIRAKPGWELLNRYEIDYDQWQQVPKEDQRVGTFIIPAHAPGTETVRPAGARILLVDPGLVFGSGLHPTTRGCLLALEHLFAHQHIRTVVDFGTGTGILAIASALLGAARVVAVDCNLLAIRVARGNFIANGVGETIHAVVADDPCIIRQESDLILMNIEWPCLTKVVAGIDWRRHALAVMSGFMDSQWQALWELLPAHHALIHQESHDGWRTVVLQARTGEV